MMKPLYPLSPFKANKSDNTCWIAKQFLKSIVNKQIYSLIFPVTVYTREAAVGEDTNGYLALAVLESVYKITAYSNFLTITTPLLHAIITPYDER